MSWDPIGVGDKPNAQDEYDDYNSPLLHLLHRREPVEVIAGWLTNLIEEHIGLDSDRSRERQLAETLTERWTTTNRC